MKYEVTAYADLENEVLIQEAISHLIKGKNLVIVAHRLNTIKQAHQIILDAGIVSAMRQFADKFCRRNSMEIATFDTYECFPKQCEWGFGSDEIRKIGGTSRKYQSVASFFHLFNRQVLSVAP